MNLIKIDRFNLQPAQAVLDFTPYGISLQAVTDVSLFIPDHRALCKNVWPLSASFNSPGHNLFRMAQPIDRSGVNPVDAQVKRSIDGRDRFAIVLSTPAELPAAPTYSPASKTQRRDK